jgi:hypothetical protein
MAFMVDILMSATVPACTRLRLDLDQAIDGSAMNTGGDLRLSAKPS